MLNNRETRSPWSIPEESSVIKETSANKAIAGGFLQGKAEDTRVNQSCPKSKGSLFVLSVCLTFSVAHYMGLPCPLGVSHSWLWSQEAFGCVSAHRVHTEECESLLFIGYFWNKINLKLTVKAPQEVSWNCALCFPSTTLSSSGSVVSPYTCIFNAECALGFLQLQQWLKKTVTVWWRWPDEAVSLLFHYFLRIWNGASSFKRDFCSTLNCFSPVLLLYLKSILSYYSK